MPIELKPLQALTLLRTLSLEQVRGEMPDLTTRQAAILLTIYLEPPPHTVRGLAAKLNVTKAGNHPRARHDGGAWPRLPAS